MTFAATSSARLLTTGSDPPVPSYEAPERESWTANQLVGTGTVDLNMEALISMECQLAGKGEKETYVETVESVGVVVIVTVPVSRNRLDSEPFMMRAADLRG